MASELRKAILEAQDLDSEIVSVPQWGDVKIEVKALTARERAKLINSAMRDGIVDMDNYTSGLILAASYDPKTGEKVFEIADRDAIANKSAAAVEILYNVATRLSGLNATAVEDAKNNFETAQSVDSSSS